MKPLQLKAYIPPKGYMITREATLAERKAIGREALVKVLAPEIWNMLHDLQGKSVRTRYWYVMQDWSLVWKDGSVKAKCSMCHQTNYFNYAEFESALMLFSEPTFVQRFWKLCNKALLDEKSRRGNARKLEEQKEETIRNINKIEIHIDLEIEAWL